MHSFCSSVLHQILNKEMKGKGGYCVLSHFSPVQLFATPWTAVHQAPLSMESSRQEYWSGLPCPSPGDLPDPGVEPVSPEASALQAASVLLSYLLNHKEIQAFFRLYSGDKIQISLFKVEKSETWVAQSFQLFATPWTIAYQAPPSTWFSGKNTGAGCHFLLQRIFLTQGPNPDLPHHRQTLLLPEPPGKSTVYHQPTTM